MTSANNHNGYNGKRVVVTGMGAISPVGLNIPDMWQALIAGKSGVDYISIFDPAPLETKFAAEAKGFDPLVYFGRKEAHRMDRFTQFAAAASIQAVEAANLKISNGNNEDTGVIIGSSVGGLLSISEQLKILNDAGPKRISPILAPTMTGDAPSVQVSLVLGTKGLSYSPSSACSSGSDAIGQAYQAIKAGDAKVMIAGGTEAPVVPLIVAAFNSLRALSTCSNGVQSACRPFDAERDGFVLGEGAAIIVIEDAEHAMERGAPILAEIASYSATSDAFHLTQPDPEGKGAARALRLALEKANLTPNDIDYINAHGTATLLNDRTETQAIKSVFNVNGYDAYHIPVSATKSMTGHLIGAAGSLEAIIAVLAINHDVVPPTINLTHPDPECDLDYVPNKARPVKVKTAMSNSFGFGGHNSVLIFREYSP
ncbi:MAG: beta-ketoacyl-ACP synthase II [Dehalococcoidia bacterium]|jgi:beta-ketoacyl-acyl-carrier-protein synthase II